MSKSFIPFHQIREYKSVIVVDSLYKKTFALSHWRGALKLKNLHADTSAGICLNAIRANIPEIAYPYLTNNHFDVDGFLGIWSLMNPVLALENAEALILAALIGDFRELDWTHPNADFALKLVCWLNTQEKERFYPPFGFKALGQNEAKICVQKYEFFLPRFEEVLRNIDAFREEWADEYEQVKLHTDILKRAESQVSIIGDIRLLIVETPEPLHYYALFGESSNCDMVLCMYDDQRYELEYKYTTWVDTATRYAFPRLHLKNLAEKLNRLEKNSSVWAYDSIMDTGPALRLEIEGLSKEERFDHPFNREIPPSSIFPLAFKEEVIRFYRQAYQHIEPRYDWTWKQMREVQGGLFV